MKQTITLFIIVFLQSISFGQSQVAKIKYEQAEEAYTNNQYSTALNYLNEAEAVLGSSNTTTLYLKIMIQNKLVAQKSGGFDMIQSLRENCKTYLVAADGITDLEDKYREVYFVSESLINYPKSKAEYELQLQKEQEEELILEKKRQEAAAIEKQRKIDEQLRAKDEAIKQQEVANRKVDYVCFNAGIGLPLSSSKDVVSFSEWQNSGVSVYNYALNAGKLGLTNAFTIGFCGINGFDKVNEKLIRQGKNFGFGLMIDFSQTFQFYSFKKMTDFPSQNSWYVENIKTKPYSITSVGMGLSVSAILGNKTFLDFYGRADFNLFSWGYYESNVSEYDPNYGTTFNATSKGYRNESETSSIGFSPSFGATFRKNQFYLGLEMRIKLIDKKASITDYLDYSYYGTGYSGKDVYTYTPINGLNFSYLGIKIGYIIKNKGGSEVISAPTTGNSSSREIKAIGPK